MPTLARPLYEGDPAVTHDDPQYRRGMRSLALGGVLQLLRTRENWSVETAAQRAGIGHMTWRRAEDGFTVRRRTYAALDAVLGLPLGTVSRALNDDRLMVELASLVIDTSNVRADQAATFVETFAQQTLSGSPRQARQLAAVDVVDELPLVVAVGQLVTRLASLPERGAAAEDALQALLRLLPELSPPAHRRAPAER